MASTTTTSTSPGASAPDGPGEVPWMDLAAAAPSSSRVDG
uniref:Uncharacterized protein n=1 Tax=Arundo donax TaxID=35708 RepID=A0A0A9HXR4_ARUDO